MKTFAKQNTQQTQDPRDRRKGTTAAQEEKKPATTKKGA